MASRMFSKLDKAIISTGNILNVNKKAGQKAHEELFDCLKATLTDPVQDIKIQTQITRANDDLRDKMTEYKREEIKIGAKIFLNTNSVAALIEALDQLLATLDVQSLDTLILAYHPRHNGTANGTASSVNGTHGEAENSGGGVSKEGVLEWGVGNQNALTDLKLLWNILEQYSREKKCCQLGIADLDTESLANLYETSTIKPTIAQINLSACCVVPPSLQEFCTKHEIQLLTHSDPEEILTASALEQLIDVSGFQPIWSSRYQVHVRCRGVLTAKGFIVGTEKH